MAKYSAEMRERARRLRDVLLDQVEDKSDPRYLALAAQVAEDDARAGRAAMKREQASAR